MPAPLKHGLYAALIALLTCTLLAASSNEAKATTTNGPLGTLSVADRVDVIGNRCGTLAYTWDGWLSSLPWNSANWNVMLYRGGPTKDPAVIVPNEITSASGTPPWVRGVDDEPAFSGSAEICDKADSAQQLSLYASWFGSSMPFMEANQSADFVVDFHPVTIKVDKTKGLVKARVLYDGQPWRKVKVKVLGLTQKATKLKTNSNGVVTVQRSKTTRGKRIKFVISDIAHTKSIPL